ncbi:MAG: PspC domain-containing protein [Candidatus Zixiibacteriota bacterium]|jgi:phage shock protein C
MTQRLYRSQMDRKIAGVCGGIAEYFDIDPTMVRIAALALIFLHGIGILIYVIAWIAMPKKPIQLEIEKLNMTPPPTTEKPPSKQRGMIPGIILISVGALILMHNMYWWWFDFEYLFPAILIVIGVIILVSMAGRKNSNNDMLPQEGTK